MTTPETAVNNPRSVQDYIDPYTDHLQSWVYLELTNFGLSDDTADRLAKKAFAKAKVTWEKTLSPTLKKALTRTNLPFPRIEESRALAEYDEVIGEGRARRTSTLRVMIESQNREDEHS